MAKLTVLSHDVEGSRAWLVSNCCPNRSSTHAFVGRSWIGSCLSISRWSRCSVSPWPVRISWVQPWLHSRLERGLLVQVQRELVLPLRQILYRQHRLRRQCLHLLILHLPPVPAISATAAAPGATAVPVVAVGSVVPLLRVELTYFSMCVWTIYILILCWSCVDIMCIHVLVIDLVLILCAFILCAYLLEYALIEFTILLDYYFIV